MDYESYKTPGRNSRRYEVRTLNLNDEDFLSWLEQNPPNLGPASGKAHINALI